MDSQPAVTQTPSAQQGSADARNYRTPVDRDTLLALTQRSDRRAILDLGKHAGALLLTGWVFTDLTNYEHWLLALPVLLIHGMVFSFLGYAGLGHELQHRSVFTHPKLNDALFYLASIVTWNNPVYFRASHSVHHRHTMHTGVDFEVNPDPTPLLAKWWRYVLFDWEAFERARLIVTANASNVVKGPFGQTAFPEGSAQRQQLVMAARACIAFHACVLVLSLSTGWWQGVLLVTLAGFICTFPNRAVAKLQHHRLMRDSNDFRQNCRTVILPGWLAFLYWNMNYHTEHHMYPNVPYWQLPSLREHIEEDLPAPVVGIKDGLNALN